MSGEDLRVGEEPSGLVFRRASRTTQPRPIKYFHLLCTFSLTNANYLIILIIIIRLGDHMPSKSYLKKKILRLLDLSIQGAPSLTFRTCGNPICACHSDKTKKHGPNLYLTFKTSDGRSSGMYVPKAYEKHVRKAVANWAKLWQALVDYAAHNRENLRQQMRKTLPLRTPKKKKS